MHVHQGQWSWWENLLYFFRVFSVLWNKYSITNDNIEQNNYYFDINLLEFLNSRGRLLKSTSSDLKPPVLTLLLGLACSRASCLSRTLLLPLGFMAKGISSLIISVVGLTAPVSVFRQYFTSSVLYHYLLAIILIDMFVPYELSWLLPWSVSQSVPKFPMFG